MGVHLLEDHGDAGRQRVPAPRGFIIRIEIVEGVETGARPALDDVFFVSTDDDEKIAIPLDPALHDGINRPPTAVTVDGKDAFDHGRFEPPGCR